MTVKKGPTCIYMCDCPLKAIGPICCVFGHKKSQEMVNTTSWFLALHPHCVSVDLEAVAQTLRCFRQRHTKAFQIYFISKFAFLLLLGSAVPSKEVVFNGRGYCWQECVTKCVLACCQNMEAQYQPSPQEMTSLFLLKSQQSFLLFLLSLETQGDKPAPPPRPFFSLSSTADPLHSTSAVPNSPPNACRNAEQASISIKYGSAGRHRAQTPPLPAPFYGAHLPEKAERARVIAFSSPRAETQTQHTGNSEIPQPWPILPLLLFLRYSHWPHTAHLQPSTSSPLRS